VGQSLLIAIDPDYCNSGLRLQECFSMAAEADRSIDDYPTGARIK
jgi:hypothetical protein